MTSSSESAFRALLQTTVCSHPNLHIHIRLRVLICCTPNSGVHMIWFSFTPMFDLAIGRMWMSVHVCFCVCMCMGKPLFPFSDQISTIQRITGLFVCRRDVFFDNTTTNRIVVCVCTLSYAMAHMHEGERGIKCHEWLNDKDKTNWRFSLPHYKWIRFTGIQHPPSDFILHGTVKCPV